MRVVLWHAMSTHRVNIQLLIYTHSVFYTVAPAITERHVRVAGQSCEPRYLFPDTRCGDMDITAGYVRLFAALVLVARAAPGAATACHTHYVTHFGSVHRHRYLHDLCIAAIHNSTAFRASLVCGAASCTKNLLVHEALRYRPSEAVDSHCIDTSMKQCAILAQTCATYHTKCCADCDFSHRDGHAIGTRYVASYEMHIVVLIVVYIVLTVAISKTVFVSYHSVPKTPVYAFYRSRDIDHP